MNLNLDFSAVTRFLRGTWNDLRQKHILPVVAVLLVAIVAVPILLSSSSSSPSQPQTPAPVPPPPSSSTLPALNVQSTPAHSVLVGKARNPFGAASGSGASTASTTAPNLGSVSSVATAAHNAVTAMNSATASSAASSAGSTTSGSSSTSSSSSGSSSTGSGSSSSSSGNPTSITGNSKPKPAPSGLTSTQAYQVSVSETNGNGVDAVASLKRLSGVPSESQPLLRELGVEQGGNRVLFAVAPGTELAGPGSCIPGPLDCEILSLGQDQTEAVGGRVGTLGAQLQAEFAVTGITAADYPSSAAASKARRAESAAGRAQLADADLPALSLFQYEPSLGYVVDLSNLTVGG